MCKTHFGRFFTFRENMSKLFIGFETIQLSEILIPIVCSRSIGSKILKDTCGIEDSSMIKEMG